MATRLTKKQQTQLTEKLSGIIQKNNALQLRLSMDRSVNEMNVNQISGELNRIHEMAIGKELPTVVTIPVKQLGSGDPSPDNVRPIVGYEIDGIGTVYGGELNIETGVLTVTYGGLDLGTRSWAYFEENNFFTTTVPGKQPGTGNAICSSYAFGGWWTNWADKDFVWTGNANNQALVIKDLRYNDAVAFKAALSGVMFAYELADPETYTLTPVQMIQLLDQL